MPDDKLGAEQIEATAAETENAGPVLFSKVGVSPVQIQDFDPVGKPVSALLKHLEETTGLSWEGKQLNITRGGEGGRVTADAIVRPGDYVQLLDPIANN